MKQDLDPQAPAMSHLHPLCGGAILNHWCQQDLAAPWCCLFALHLPGKRGGKRQETTALPRLELSIWLAQDLQHLWFWGSYIPHGHQDRAASQQPPSYPCHGDIPHAWGWERADETLQPRGCPIALLAALAFSSNCFAEEEIQAQGIPGGTETDGGIPGGV